MSSFRCLGVISLVPRGVIGATRVIIQVYWCHQSGATWCDMELLVSSFILCLGVISLVSPGVIGATRVIIQVYWCHQSGATWCDWSYSCHHSGVLVSSVWCHLV